MDEPQYQVPPWKPPTVVVTKAHHAQLGDIEGPLMAGRLRGFGHREAEPGEATAWRMAVDTPSSY
jgi:hypothetical protein